MYVCGYPDEFPLLTYRANAKSDFTDFFALVILLTIRLEKAQIANTYIYINIYKVA